MIYELTGVKKAYRDNIALDIESLGVREGDIYALLGPNGAGKTTLLRIMAFLEAPTSGQVCFRSGKVCFDERHLQPLRRHVVMVNQRPILFTTSVFKNLEFGLKIRKIPRETRRRIIEQSLEMVGLLHLADAPAESLSGGETQRVAIARSLALSPSVILCDEPTSNVDVENQGVVVNLLKEINREKKITIVFTTHDRLLAASLARQTLFMDRGRLAKIPYENLFTGDLTTEGSGIARCEIRDLFEIDIPSHRSGKARLHIDPAKISMTRTERANSVRGQIARIVYDRDRVRVRVESHVTIRVSISIQEYHKHKYMVGEDLFLSLKPDAVELL